MTAIPEVVVRDTTDADGKEGWQVTITHPASASLTRSMAAHRDERGRLWPLPDGSGPDQVGGTLTVERVVALVTAVKQRTATAAEAVELGRHLFDALIGAPGLQVLLGAATPGATPPAAIPVGLRFPSGALHQYPWELLHDGTDHLTLRDPGAVVLLRLPPTDGAAPPTVTRTPRVLFAVGTTTAEKDVRAGAEVMGVLRGVERGAGAISARVLMPASRSAIQAETDRFRPDVVHVISHGRWDAQNQAGWVTLQHDGRPGTEEHTAATLATALGRPALVVLSVCESGLADIESGAPIAAELIAAGIPLVVAMAGRISDTACRVYTRTVGSALTLGMPFVAALATGRRAAFAYAGATPQEVDWALPAAFARCPIDAAYQLVDPASAKQVKTFIARHEDVQRPLFAGRHDLLGCLDEVLLPDGDSAGALVLHSTYPSKVGGSRALIELAAEAVRSGHLTVRTGPYGTTDVVPTTLSGLAASIGLRCKVIARQQGVDPPGAILDLLVRSSPAGATPPAELSTELVELLGPDPSPDDFVDAVRADLLALRDRVAAQVPGVIDATKVPLLLLDDVHRYDRGLAPLLALLTGDGLGSAATKLPVVVFGKTHEDGGADLERLRLDNESGGKLLFRRLLHVSELSSDEAHHAFLCWLLNPNPRAEGWPTKVAAPRGEDTKWVDVFSLTFKDRSFYDPQVHCDTVRVAVDMGWLVEDDDDAIAAAVGLVP